MDKNQYKELIGDYVNQISDLEKRIKKLENDVLELIMENSELKDEIKNHSQYAETDGYEVGSPSDYEDNGQLDLFNVSK